MLAGCPDFVPAPEARIICESAGDCPTGWSCEASVGRCLPNERPDETPPAIVTSSVAPENVGAGDEITISVEVDEDLDHAATLEVGGVSATAALEDGAWTATVVVPDGEAVDEGNQTVEVTLVDEWGNVAVESLGTVFFDYTAPVVEPLVFTLPTQKSAARGDDVLALELTGEADLEVKGAVLLGLPGEVELAEVVASDPRASAGGTAVDLTVDLGGLDLTDVDELRVDVTVVGGRPDNASPEGVVSSEVLPLDLDAPTDPSLSFIEGDVTTSAEVTAVLAAAGATLVCVSGDHAGDSSCADGDFVALPGDGELPLTLTSGEGPKSLTAVFRDDAFNETAPVSATIAYLTGGAAQVAPTLTLPIGQTALKNGDTLIVGGTAPEGGALVSARLLDVASGGTLQDVDLADLTLSAAGALSGSFDVAGMPDVDATGGDADVRVALEVIVSVGPLSSVAADSRSADYPVDNVAPTGPSVVIAEGGEVSSTSVRVQLDATGASEVRLDGDLVSAANVRTWVPLQAEIGVTLVAMDGMRAISAEFRDGAHNLASASTMVLLDRNAPEISVTITSPNTRLDDTNVPGVKAGDSITATAVADVGATVDSGTIFYLDDSLTPLPDATCSRDVTNQLTLVDNNDATARVLDASVSVGTPCAGAAHVTLRVIIRSSAGALSDPAASTANTLFVDVTPPTGTAEHVLEADAEPGYARTTGQTLTLAATDDRGVEPTVRLTGDLVAGARVDTFVALTQDGAEAVELTAGAGNKSITVTYRDEVGNLGTPIVITLELDTGAPLAPLLTALRLRAQSPAAEDVDLVDGASDRFFLTGVAGAIAEPRAFVYADSGLTQRLQFPLGAPTDDELVVATDGSFAEVELPVGVSGTVWVVSVDEAGNPSTATAVAVPVFSNISVGGQARNDQPFNLTFTSDVALDANPTVTVGGTAASYVGVSGLNYTYSVDLDGSEPEGVGAAVVRVYGDAAAPASGSTGTNATVATLDFTAPVISAGLVTLTESDPLNNDLLAAAAGAILDNAGADAMPASSLTTTVRQADNTLVAAPSLAGDGSFAQLSLGDNASNSFTLRVVDEAGNASTLVLSNDIVAPTLANLAVAPGALRQNATADITFDVTDDENDLDALPAVTVGGANASHSSGAVGVGGQGAVGFAYTYTATTGADGTRTVSVVATDTAGNERTLTGSVVVDFTDPSVTCADPGNRATWNGASPIAGTAGDATSGVEAVEVSVRRDATGQYWGGAGFNQGTQTWLTGTGTTSWTRAADMTFTEGEDYTVHVRARDVAQNLSPVTGPLTFTYDVTDPNTTITTPPPATTDATDADIAFTCNDTPCTFECQLDGGGFSACTSPVVLADLSLGAHTFEVRATDEAGNLDDTPASASWTVLRRFVEIAHSDSSNGHFICGIAQSGELFCWGETNTPYTFVTSTHPTASPLAINSDTDWAHVAVSFHHGCATKTDGRLFCFGNNQFGGLGVGGGNPNPNLFEVGGTGWKDVAVGEQHSCALRDNGVADGGDDLYCWGKNTNPAFGTGGAEGTDLPQQVTAGPTAWKKITAGILQTCGIGIDDRGYCWGRSGFNYALGVGVGDQDDRDVPTQISLTASLQDIDHKAYTGCAVTTGGELYCWGSNNFLHGGDAGGGSLQVPTKVGTDTDWESVARGETGTCALKTGGDIYCWGGATYGERGDGVANSAQTTAAPQLVGSGYDRVFAGASVAFFGRTDGRTECAGHNQVGQCGLGTVGDKFTLTQVATSVSDHSQGGSHAHYLSGGTIYATGVNRNNELGDESYNGRAAWGPSIAGTAFEQVVASGFTSCGRRTDDTVVCWGRDNYGGLGAGAGDQGTGSNEITGTWADIDAADGHVCGVRVSGADQLLECWGLDFLDFVNVESPSPVDGNVDTDWASVSIGSKHACGLKTNGDAYCWGDAQSGRLGNNIDNFNLEVGPTAVHDPAEGGPLTFVQVAAGYATSAGIDDTGKLWSWGSLAVDDTGIGMALVPVQLPDTGPWLSVDTFDSRVCAVRGDGTLWCWGRPFEQPGQAPLEPYQVESATNWVDVRLGAYDSVCARNTSNELWCMGYNPSGVLGDGTAFYLTPTLIPEP